MKFIIFILLATLGNIASACADIEPVKVEELLISFTPPIFQSKQDTELDEGYAIARLKLNSTISLLCINS